MSVQKISAATSGAGVAPFADDQRLTGVERALIDQYGRISSDLRVSLTDRCNLRCTYCMPAEGLPWQPPEQVLTNAEMIRLITIAVTRCGITKVRFTGGEPLLRPHLTEIVSACHSLTTANSTAPDLALTTNAVSLARFAEPLALAGLNRVNVSLDTLDQERYQRYTRRDRLHDVLAGLRAARTVGLTPIKVNAVPQPGHYRDDAAELLRFCLTEGYQLRFIEQMPLGPQGSWDRDTVVTRDDLLLAFTGAHFDLVERDQRERGAAPAQLWDVTDRLTGARGTVGIIASVTAPFCQACTRTRLTADGQVRSCLFSHHETDLRGLLRGGASDDEIAERWQEAMWGKPRAHGIDDGDFARPSRTMSAIGG